MNENILIVEDDPHLAEHLSLLLRQLGFRVAGVAVSGESALAQAAQARPDLIIMDILLEGGVDGIETAQHINAMHPIPILFLTVHDDEAFFRRANITRPYAYLLKPPSERELALAIELALYRHQVEQQQAHAFPVADGNGKTYRIAGVSEEVTQRRESEEQYRTIVQGSMDGFWAVDAGGRCLDVNEAYCQLIGYTREELLGMTIGDIEAAETPEQTQAHIRHIIEIGQDRFETRHRHRNGHLIDVEVSTNFVDIAEGDRFYVFVRDISGHKQREESLRLSEEKFRMFFERAPIGLAIAGKDYRFVEVNRALCRLLDYSPAELTTKTFVEITHPRDVEADVTLAGLLFAGEIPFYTLESRLLKRDGSFVWTNLTVTTIQDRDGHPMYGLGMVEDISARKRAERERLAHEAAQRDALVREVHHRIKNNLHGVLGLLRQHTARHPETAAVIEEAINQIGAVAAVHGLQGRHTGDSISLQALLLEITKLASATIGGDKHPELRITLNKPVSIAAHEVVAIALVLNELLLNAIKHGTADSTPLLELHDGGGKAHIAITNHGQLPQGFDYDKGRGLGTGLGLVKALMPRKGATLSLRQDDDRIIATMHLETPVVLLDGRAEGA